MNSKIATLATVVTTACLFLATSKASAVDVGLGAGISSSNDTVYVPIRFGNFRIEPEISFSNDNGKYTYSTSPSNNYKYESRWTSMGTGIYWRHSLLPSLESYVGGRLGYSKNDYSYTYPNNPSNSYKENRSGFYVGPTLGAEYFFNKQISLGLDVSLIVNMTSQKQTANSGTTQKSDRTDTYTETRTALRVYF